MDVEALVVLVVLVCGLNPAGNGPSKVKFQIFSTQCFEKGLLLLVKEMKRRRLDGGVVSTDLSEGLEKQFKVRCVNDVDDAGPPKTTYTVHNILRTCLRILYHIISRLRGVGASIDYMFHKYCSTALLHGTASGYLLLAIPSRWCKR